MPPITYKYTKNREVPAAFWFFVLDKAYQYNVPTFAIPTDTTFIDMYDQCKESYKELRVRIKRFLRTFGEGRFVCDGIVPRPGDDKAGGPHRCALLETSFLPPHPLPCSPRYEDWDAKDARRPFLAPSYQSLFGRDRIADNISQLMDGLAVTPPSGESITLSPGKQVIQACTSGGALRQPSLTTSSSNHEDSSAMRVMNLIRQVEEAAIRRRKKKRACRDSLSANV